MQIALLNIHKCKFSSLIQFKVCFKVKKRLKTADIKCNQSEATAIDLEHLIEAIKEAEAMNLPVEDIQQAYDTVEILHKRMKAVIILNLLVMIFCTYVNKLY